MERHLEVVQWLKEQGADINKDSNGWTPLYVAAGNGHLEVVQWLKEQGPARVTSRLFKKR
jgi:ankyrin repeat protein